MLALLVEVLDLHDVKGGNERVDLFALGVDEAGLFEFGSKVELSLDLKLLLKKFVNPALKYLNND